MFACPSERAYVADRGVHARDCACYVRLPVFANACASSAARATVAQVVRAVEKYAREAQIESEILASVQQTLPCA
eukprot:147176-Pleurochrysis_carterae.AAC.1